MTRLAVYDPPMCCSTGACGPSVDEAIVRFAADLDWLRQRGVAVERYNLSRQPHDRGRQQVGHEPDNGRLVARIGRVLDSLCGKVETVETSWNVMFLCHR